MKSTLLASFTLLSGLALPLAAELEIKDTKGEHLDVVDGDKLVVRYMYAHDTSSKERRLETYKPYLHVYDADGETLMTKGVGDPFTHHRGVFIGWNRITFKGQKFDRWHMNNGEIVHQKFTKTEAEGRDATIESVTHWHDAEESSILDEVRTMGIDQPEEGKARLIITFRSKLTAAHGDISLKGDPEHAGVQFRPSAKIEKQKTKYFFPEGVDNVKSARDLPWIAETMVIGGKTYTVVQLNHPSNPKGTKHSAYRDYGRFGSFFEKDLKKGEVLEVNYQFLICDGEMKDTRFIEKSYKNYVSPPQPK